MHTYIFITQAAAPPMESAATVFHRAIVCGMQGNINLYSQLTYPYSYLTA